MNPETLAVPLYWVNEENCIERRPEFWSNKWTTGWRRVSAVTNERTFLETIFPDAGFGDSIFLMYSSLDPKLFAQMAVSLSTAIFDYITRQKMGGVNLSFFVCSQLPVLPPETFSRSLPWLGTPTIADFVRPRVLELTYTAWDMKPFAEDLGYGGAPFAWDEERRFALRCELDALFFHLYLPSNADGSWKQAEGETAEELVSLKDAFPTPRSAVDYIMDTFPIRKRKDIAEHGTYRTKETILKVYDAMQEAMAEGVPFRSGLFA